MKKEESEHCWWDERWTSTTTHTW